MSHHRLSRSLLAATATFCMCDAVNAAGNFAYMSTISGAFGQLNLETGVFAQSGNSGLTLAGLAGFNGVLYGASYLAGGLYTVSTADGSLSLVGSSAGVVYEEFGSTPSGLYAVSTDLKLYSVNPTNGTATLLGATGLGVGGTRSLSNNSSSLYWANGSNIYTLSVSTGAATLLGSTGGPSMGAMVYTGGHLYGGVQNPGVAGIAIATIDTSSGVATIGAPLSGISGSNSRFYGLAPNPLPVPDAPSGSLLLLGLAALAGWGKRVRQRAGA